MSDQALVDKLSNLVHPQLGIIRSLVEAELQPDEAPIHIGLCEFANPLKIRPQRISDEEWQKGAIEEARQPTDVRAGALNPVGRKHATGAAGDRDTAMWATIGEGCERYAMHLDAAYDAISAREDELPDRFVSPRDFILFAPEQYDQAGFRFVRHDPSLPLLWRRAQSLTDGLDYHVPAQFVSGPMSRSEKQPLDFLYSTGCAAGSSPAHAVSTALRETIERDAFMFYWLSRATPRRIKLASAAQHLPEWLRPFLSWKGLDIHALWFEADHGIPVICTLLLPQEGEGVAIGASCHLDWRIALEKAVIESFHTLNWVIDMDRWQVEPPEIEDVRDFHDHVAYYRGEGRRSMVEFLTRGADLELAPPEGLPGAEDYRAQTGEMVRRLARRGFDTYVIDLTPADLESIEIFVAKTLVPGMHPLNAGVGTEHLDRRRLEQFAQGIGIELPDSLNLDPHPFP